MASLPLLGYTVSTPEEVDGIHKEYVFKLQFKSHVYFFRAESEYTFERYPPLLVSQCTGVSLDQCLLVTVYTGVCVDQCGLGSACTGISLWTSVYWCLSLDQCVLVSLYGPVCTGVSLWTSVH